MRVGADADRLDAMDVAAIDPEVMDVLQAYAVGAVRHLEAAQKEVAGRRSGRRSEVDGVLPFVRSRQNRAGLTDDADRRGRGSLQVHLEERVHRPATRAHDQEVSGLQSFELILQTVAVVRLGRTRVEGEAEFPLDRGIVPVGYVLGSQRAPGVGGRVKLEGMGGPGPQHGEQEHGEQRQRRDAGPVAGEDGVWNHDVKDARGSA